MDVTRWLHDLGLSEYAEAFRDNAIDAEVLRELTAEDLKDLGVTLVGHRRRLLAAIAALRDPSPAAPDSALPAAADAARSQAAERRQLTVLFCDLVGSTELARRLDPEDMSLLLRAYRAAVADEIVRFEGHIAKFMGDGVLAYFGWPKAHEDEAERAVRAGLAIPDAVGRVAAPAPLAVRIGIATGLVMVGDLIGEGAAREEAVVGETPNLAARLQQLAEPGTVVIADGTRRLLGGLFELADLGAHQAKGFAEPVCAFRVVSEGRAESRFEARHGAALLPLIGREQELALLLDRWAHAEAGEGQVVLLAGEAGIGKSRLMLALRERVRQEPQTSLRYFCSPYHTNSALYPVIAQLERAAGFSRDDPPAARLAKLEALLATAVAEPGEATALLGELLGLPLEGRERPELTPQQRRARTFQALLAHLEGLAARQPVLMVLEDAHWLDPTSLELFGLIIDRIQRLPVLLVVTHRPEQEPPWRGYPHVTTLTLSRLARTQAQAMVDHLTGGRPLPATLLDPILLKTDGVPLFVEELTKAVLESGLVREDPGGYALCGPLPPLAIPATLHDSLMARLDHLAPIKSLIQTGAVIGREFSHELLGAVTRLPAAELDAALDQLVASELVFRHGLPPDATYRFKHALVQEAASQSLLRSRRCDLHARIAAVLEDHFPQIAGAEPELVAHHWSEAAVVAKAVACWSMAGRRAVERFANPEAIGHFGRALEMLGTLPEEDARDRRELELRVVLTVPLIATYGFGSVEVERCTRRAKEIADRLGDAEHRFTATRAVWNSSLLRQPVPETLALSEEVLPLAEATADPVQLAMAYRARGYSLFIAGELRAALSSLERGTALADALPEPARVWVYGEHPGMVCRAYAGQTLMLLGLLDQATALTNEAIAVARGLANPHTLAWALVVAAQSSVLRRDFAAARAQAEEAADLARTRHLPQWLGGAMVYRGCARTASGDLSGGIAEMEGGVAHWLGTGAVLHTTHHRAVLAAACIVAGELQRARMHLAVGQRHADDFGECYAQAELHCIAAQIRLREGASVAEVAVGLHHALEIAAAQDARLWQLHAAQALARLWAEQGERRKGYDLLAPVYAWFTEGFETADLKEAKALLDQLA